jgi:hypothetical protein
MRECVRYAAGDQNANKSATRVATKLKPHTATVHGIRIMWMGFIRLKPDDFLRTRRSKKPAIAGFFDLPVF